MAAISSPSDNIAGVLENLSLDPQTKTAEIPENAKDIYGNNDAFMYHQGYGYMPFGTYPSPNSTIPAMGNDGQFYGTQQYQYPNPFYQAPSSTGTFHSPNSSNPSHVEAPTPAAADKASLSVGMPAANSNNAVNNGSVRSNGAKPFKPSNQNSHSNLNGAYKREGLPAGFPTSGYHDPRFGYDAYQSPMPWLDASMFSNPAGHALNSGFSSPLNLHLTRPMSSSGQGSGAVNLMYPSNRIYGQYGYRSGAGSGFGSYGANSWTNGQAWLVVDNKYKPKARGYGNENIDGLSELNRGPRAKGFKNQTEVGPVAQAVHSLKISQPESHEDNLSQIPDSEHYNREDFPEDYSNAKFFVIKSYSEDDVHKSIKYGVWASTPNGNKKLDAAYHEAKEIPGGCPVFLLFSVNTSGQFVGLAEMVGSVDFNKTVQYWQQEKWIGCFPVKWHVIKDVPNGTLRHITLENNEDKPVTNSRDTQEVMFEKGIQLLKIFKGHKGKTSILDDFGFYAARERIMQEKRAKQKIQKQVLDGKPTDNGSDSREKGATDLTDTVAVLKEPVSGGVEAGRVEENGSGSAAESSPKKSGVVSSENKVASAC